MRRLIPIFVAGFFFSVHLALLAYMNSTMLSQFASERWISIIFTLSAALSLVLLYAAPRMVRTLGNTRMMGLIALTSVVLLTLIGLSPKSIAVAPVFIIYFALNTLMLYGLDIYVEHYSRRATTGNTRGLYLTICNLGWVAMPFVAGSISTTYSISTVYVVAAAAVALMLLILVVSQYRFKDTTYHAFGFGELFAGLRKLPEVRRIITLNFMLQFFFACMVIYLPLYFRESFSLTLAQMGIIFTVMLLPFVLCSYPAGRLADKIKNGEKKFLILGLMIAGLSTLLLMHYHIASVVLFALTLFASRVGASVVEVMCDSYFFKRISDSEAGIIGLYRGMLPLAYIIAPLAGAALLSFISYNTLFILLGILMLIGAIYATRIPKDF